MTISKGQPWGDQIDRPSGIPVADSDAELAELAAQHRGGEVGLRQGDVYQTLGRPDTSSRRALRLPMDLLTITTDIGAFPAVAHVVAQRHWYRGTIIVVMNVSRLGVWDVVPAAHPNDGRFETLEVAPEMSLRQRLLARRRLRAGTHLPHPHVRVRHRTEARFTFERPVRCQIDGVSRGNVGTMAVTIEPDAFSLIV